MFIVDAKDGIFSRTNHWNIKLFANKILIDLPITEHGITPVYIHELVVTARQFCASVAQLVRALRRNLTTARIKLVPVPKLSVLGLLFLVYRPIAHDVTAPVMMHLEDKLASHA